MILCANKLPMTDRVEIMQLETIRENMRNFHLAGARTFTALVQYCQRRENVANAIRLWHCYGFAEFLEPANFDRAVTTRGCLKRSDRLVPAV